MLHAYSTALSLLQRCLLLSPALETQLQFLTRHGCPTSLASKASSYAVEVGELEKAVEILEQGRALLLSEMRGLRSSLNKLHATKHWPTGLPAPVVC
jgi:hypothetical protein